MSDRTELRRLLLELERAMVARGQIRALLADADSAIAHRRLDVRNLKAQIAREARGPAHTT